MWVRKWERDQKKGVDSPIPTQVLLERGIHSPPQTKQQDSGKALIGELAEEKARKLGMQRRDFMRTSMGMATAFLASNMSTGPIGTSTRPRRSSRPPRRRNGPRANISSWTCRRTSPTRPPVR